MRIVTARQMQELDRRAIAELGMPSLVLMERAALGVADAICERIPRPGTAAVLTGTGNNGGDGAAVARLLGARGWRVKMLVAGDLDKLTPDARHQFELAERLGIERIPAGERAAEDWLDGADLWIDALLGVGLRGAVRAPYAPLLESCSALLRERSAAARAPFRVAVDLPSGLCSDTGALLGSAIPADVTVTFAAPKWGLFMPPGIDAVGELVIVDIGIPAAWAERDPETALLCDDYEAARLWRPTPRSAHKGTRGRLLAVAGSSALPGAAMLCTRSAVLAGAGLVTLCADPAVCRMATQLTPEVMGADPELLAGGVPDRFDVVLAGPGMGTGADAENRLESVLRGVGTRPLVLDADALTLLSKRGALPDGLRAILTPHPGELARLLGATTVSVTENLVAAARTCASRYRAVVVAKTCGAIVTDGVATRFVRAGSPAMAVGGSGDVLAGIVAARVHRADLLDAATLGAWIHAEAGRAGASATGEESLGARGIADALPRAFARLRDIGKR